MLRDYYTVIDVKRYRDENSCGLLTAKSHFRKLNLLRNIQAARKTRDFDLLCDAVEELITKHILWP